MVGYWSTDTSCSCSLRPSEKMTMQKKHRSKGRVLRAQSLQAQFQVLAQSSYLGQIRLCHLPQRAAELSWRTREEETRMNFFCRPQGAHISCRNHLKLFFFFSGVWKADKVFLRVTEKPGKSIGKSPLKLHSSETAHQGDDTFIRVHAP